MVELSPPLRRGLPADADRLAEFVNYAGEGLPHYLWSKLAQPEQSAWDVGRERALRESGSFSYRNAYMFEADGEAVGCLIGYEIPDQVEPVPDDMPAMFRPLQELENLAPGSWYVNVLAVAPAYRGRGIGGCLLDLGDAIGRECGKKSMSVIVSDANSGARALYEHHGYVEGGRRAMVKETWENDGRNWVLLTKKL